MPKITKINPKSFGDVFSKNKPIPEAADNPADKLPHLVVRALAGCGKTSTVVEGVRLMIEGKTDLFPNDQQSEIWSEILKSHEAKSICMVAFNKEIADELKKRIPKCVYENGKKTVNIYAATLHSLGLTAINATFGGVPVDQDKSKRLLAQIRKISYEELIAKSGTFAYEVSQLVSKCKLHLFNKPSTEDLDWINETYDLGIDNNLSHTQSVTAVLNESGFTTTMVDYDDMVWLPLVNSQIELPKWDLLLIDEGHDLDFSQQELVMRIGRRIVYLGDENQSIYSFRGSDSQSFSRMEQRLAANKTTVKLPLTVTYRCSKAVVREAQKWVPDLVACEDAVEGSVTHKAYDVGEQSFDCPSCGRDRISFEVEGWEQCLTCEYKWRMPKSYHSIVEDGDMIICRTNAPLIAECLKFIKAGRKAYIRGRRDVAKGLVKLIKKIAAKESNLSMVGFLNRLRVWKNIEVDKADAKKDDRQVAYIKDQFACISHFVDNSIHYVSQLVTKVENLFGDNEQRGIMLGTIHQVKGLEASNVFFLMPPGAECPAPWAKTAEQKEQERHLRYVGITRSRENLYYVS